MENEVENNEVNIENTGQVVENIESITLTDVHAELVEIKDIFSFTLVILLIWFILACFIFRKGWIK